MNMRKVKLQDGQIYMYILYMWVYTFDTFVHFQPLELRHRYKIVIHFVNFPDLFYPGSSTR